MGQEEVVIGGAAGGNPNGGRWGRRCSDLPTWV